MGTKEKEKDDGTKDKKERENLIQKILSFGGTTSGKTMKPNSVTPRHIHKCDIDDAELMGIGHYE